MEDKNPNANQDRTSEVKHILSIPITSKDVSEFKSKLWTRYADEKTGNVINQDRAITYVERVIDRITNKARGILTFNSLSIAFVGIERTNQTSVLLMKLKYAAFFVSSFISLVIFWVHWGAISAYGTFEDEFKSCVNLIWLRSMMLQTAIIFSLFGLLGIAWLGLAY